MKPETSIRRLVVLGGGTAGWMTAAVLSTVMKSRDMKITLVESETIGTVGVGEATIPQILTLTTMLGLDEDEFIRRTNATFKLGIEFVNWSQIGSRYLHPFGDYGVPLEGIEFHHFWLRECQERAAAGLPPIPLEDYNLQATAAKAGKFMRPVNQPNSPLAAIAYAFHFDAIQMAAYLRELSEAAGVQRKEGKVTDVKRDGESGLLTALTLDDGSVVEGDFFIDCSGFKGVLIEDALRTGYDDWSHWLPVDRAVAVPTTRSGPPDSFTRATAHGAGWQWRIPLQHRMGNGHVYCSSFIDDDEAVRTLLEHAEGDPMTDIRHLRFKTGRRRKFWNGNVLALGLAAGFMEPLESTSIHLAQAGLARFLQMFPDRQPNPLVIDQYNAQTTIEYERVRDFLILHYNATQRTDTDFWNHVRTMDIPDTLTQKYEMWRTTGRIFREQDELFNPTSWLAVLVGQEMPAERYHPLVDALTEDELAARLKNIRDVVANSTDYMPNHGAFIDENCAAAKM